MAILKYMYIDESGDLGKYGSPYFTIAAIIVDDPKSLSGIIKKLRQRKLKKKIRQMPEIKANNSNHIDKKHTNTLVRNDFNKYIETKLKRRI